MKNKFLFIIIFCLFVLVFPFVSSQTLYVNSTSNYTTIQSAIDNASNGDTVIAGSGIYNENIIINKSITLLGAQNGIDAKTRSTSNESIINSSFYDGTIQVQANNVVIDGFKIINAYKAIHVTIDSSNLTVINNIVFGPVKDGINLWKAKSAYVENNLVGGANVSGITGGDDRGTFDKSDDLTTKATIKNNIVENSRYGITGYQKNSVIEGNVIRDYSIGEGAGIGGQFIGVDIKDNFVKGYSYGAGFAVAYNGDFPNRSNSSQIKFKDNILINNYAGIFVNQTILGKAINISYNKIFDNSIGAGNANTDSFESLNAEYNYWGSCQGPLPGNISGYVNYEPWIGVCVKKQNISSECLIENESVILNAEISGYCISDVVFSVSKNNLWTNYSSSSHIEENYSLNLANLSSSYFEWKAYAVDCLNSVNESSVKNFYIYPRTKLTTAPLEPNGEDGWYITNPIFTLTNPNVSKIYYKWDSLETLPYSTFFGFENATNNQSITGGIIDLNYWSNLSCGRNESIQSVIIKVDLFNPKITDLIPANNSIFHGLMPKISALIDEVYGSNSGINKSSIILKLDGEVINPIIIMDNLNAFVEYTPSSNLSEDIHNVSIYVEDYAGRSSEIEWSFKVKEIEKFNMSIYSPKNATYGSMRIQFNITTDKQVKLIEYIDWNDGRRWTKLCTDCNSYGNSSNKTKTFGEGQHNLTIKAANEFGFSVEKNILFFVDSKVPQIYNVLPKINEFTNGSNFYIKFSEDNIKEVILVINKTLPYSVINCLKIGRYTECYANISLSSFNGKEIEYYFNVSDFVRTTSSKTNKIKVDTKDPVVNNKDNFFTQGEGRYSKYINFNISITEPNFYKVTYVNTSNSGAIERTLCTRLTNGFCVKKQSFVKGDYSLTIKIYDKAGNVIEIPVSFKVK